MEKAIKKMVARRRELAAACGVTDPWEEPPSPFVVKNESEYLARLQEDERDRAWKYISALAENPEAFVAPAYKVDVERVRALREFETSICRWNCLSRPRGDVLTRLLERAIVRAWQLENGHAVIESETWTSSRTFRVEVDGIGRDECELINRFGGWRFEERDYGAIDKMVHDILVGRHIRYISMEFHGDIGGGHFANYMLTGEIEDSFGH